MTEQAAVYIRTGGARHHEVSGGRQGELTETLVRSQGYELTLVYQDAEPGRSAWHNMMQDAESGDFDVVVAYHPDRLFSTLQELALLMTLVDEGHIRVEFVRSSIDLEDTTGRLAARIMANAYEAEDEYARTRQQADDKMRDSHWRRRKGDR